MIDMERSVPGYILYVVLATTLGLAAHAALLRSAFGLFRLEPSARAVSIGYGIYAVLAAAAGLAYQLAVYNPAVAKWLTDHPKSTPGTIGPGWLGDVAVIAGRITLLAFGVAVLVVMFRRDVTDAFSGRGPMVPEKD
jgi:hypothetical protein